jgi:hypothetical protein
MAVILGGTLTTKSIIVIKLLEGGQAGRHKQGRVAQLVFYNLQHYSCSPFLTLLYQPFLLSMYVRFLRDKNTFNDFFNTYYYFYFNFGFWSQYHKTCHANGKILACRNLAKNIFQSYKMVITQN